MAARGGLAGYLTVLEDAFTYVPLDSIVWGILKSGDIADIVAALAPRPVARSGLVNGRNTLVEGAEIENTFNPAKPGLPVGGRRNPVDVWHRIAEYGGLVDCGTEVTLRTSTVLGGPYLIDRVGVACLDHGPLFHNGLDPPSTGAQPRL